MNLFQTAIGIAVGLLSWTLLEYIIHYVLGHLPKGKMLISAEHIKHHKDILYFSPLPLKVRGAVPVLTLLGGAAWWLVTPAFSIGFLVAISAGWITYEFLHQSVHVKGPKTWYARWATKYHLYHHFGRPDRNHGVTTPLWDLILGTYTPVTQVQIRQRDVASVPWLAEALAMPESARPAFVNDYQVRQPK